MGAANGAMVLSSFMGLPVRTTGCNIIFVWLQRNETTYEEITLKI